MARKYAILEGTINGVNTTFTLPSGQTFVANSVILIHNGLSIHRTDTFGFTEVGNTTLQLNVAPQATDVLLCWYDDGAVDATVIDIDVTGNTLNFQTDWNGQQYKIEYSIQLASVEYNSSNYSLNYNTNSFVI